MTRISDLFSLVKTFFQNIFSVRFSFEQQFRLFIVKAFETLFKVYVKMIDDNFFHSNERKEKFKSKRAIIIPSFQTMGKREKRHTNCTLGMKGHHQ